MDSNRPLAPAATQVDWSECFRAYSMGDGQNPVEWSAPTNKQEEQSTQSSKLCWSKNPGAGTKLTNQQKRLKRCS